MIQNKRIPIAFVAFVSVVFLWIVFIIAWKTCERLSFIALLDIGVFASGAIFLIAAAIRSLVDDSYLYRVFPPTKKLLQLSGMMIAYGMCGLNMLVLTSE